MDPVKAVSARFFVELALGLFATLACIDRRAIGAGFARLMALFTLICLVPAWLLVRSGEPVATPAGAWPGLAFALLVALVIGVAGRAALLETAVIGAALIAGSWSLLAAAAEQLTAARASFDLLLAASALGSTLTLGLVTGAMVLGHWYLVTPDLPVVHLGRVTKFALGAIYAKLVILAATVILFSERFELAARSFGAAFGIGTAGGAASFQSALDFLWVLARLFIGLVGPAVLCHMTLATVRLKATQPATGILYAATVMVLMGELFAYVGERSFALVL